MRTNVTDVKSILDNTTLSDPVITRFINSANVFITNTLGNSTLTAEVLEEIEMWLSAHFISVSRERMAAKEEAGGAKIEYVGKTGEGLNSTSYGQTAMALDTTGTLTNIALNKTPISITAL